MGVIVIAAILATYVVAKNFTDPEITALIVLGMAALLFAVGSTIVHSFDLVVEMAQMKSEFVSVVSHELRSPLSAIRWSLELLTLEGNGASFGAPTKAVIDSVRERADKMNRLISTLLEIRRVQDHQLELRPEAFSLKEATHEALLALSAFARAANVRVELDAPDTLPDAYGDSKKFQMVIENLIDNAIRYGGANAPVVIRIHPEKQLVWRIEDSGSGIPKEDLKNIFQMFYRAHNVFRYRAGGLGVGLYLARSIVEASGGEMHFESEEGKGSAFWFTVPRAPLIIS